MRRLTDEEYAYRSGYIYANEELGTENDWGGTHILSFRSGFAAGIADLSARRERESVGCYGDIADPFDFGGAADAGSWMCDDEI